MDFALHHGDCMDYMHTMHDNQVELLLTDIPYDVVNRDSNGLRNLDKGKADICTFDLEGFMTECTRVTSGSIYIFCGTEQVSSIRAQLVDAGMTTRLCVWEKSNPSPMNGQHVWLSSVECCVFGKKRGATFNRHCEGTVWRYPTVRGKLHPTMKPLKLMEYIVESSSNPGDAVFDPCMGSGSTGVAALNLGRRFLGIEKDATYFEVAKNRINESCVQTV